MGSLTLSKKDKSQKNHEVIKVKVDQDIKLKGSPTTIFLNVNENILIVQSQRWIGLILLEPDYAIIGNNTELELNLIGLGSYDVDSYFDDLILDAKFHPLSPFALCILKDPSMFQMYDFIETHDYPIM